jgi:hypothetical protein
MKPCKPGGESNNRGMERVIVLALAPPQQKTKEKLEKKQEDKQKKAFRPRKREIKRFN